MGLYCVDEYHYGVNENSKELYDSDKRKKPSFTFNEDRFH